MKHKTKINIKKFIPTAITLGIGGVFGFWYANYQARKTAAALQGFGDIGDIGRHGHHGHHGGSRVIYSGSPYPYYQTPVYDVVVGDTDSEVKKKLAAQEEKLAAIAKKLGVKV